MFHRTRLLWQGAALLAALALPSSLRAQDPPAGDDPSAEAPEGRIDRREVLVKMRAAEVEHRERLATIHRLSQIAEDQGEEERMALLDKLEVKENSRYLTVANSAAIRLGDSIAYKQSLLKLAAGRIRRVDTPAEPKVTPELAAKRRARKEVRDAKAAAERAAAEEAKAARKEEKARAAQGSKPAGETPAEQPAGEPAPADRPAGETDEAGEGQPAEGEKSQAQRAATETAPRKEPARTRLSERKASRAGSGSSGARSSRSQS